MNSIPYLNLISGRQEKGRRAEVLNSHSLKKTLSLSLLHVVPSVCTAKPFLKSIYTCGGLFHTSQTNSGVTATHSSQSWSHLGGDQLEAICLQAFSTSVAMQALE